MTKNTKICPSSESQLAREGDEGEVGGVQHQLDRHEDDQRVAPHQHADHADQEQQWR